MIPTQGQAHPRQQSTRPGRLTQGGERCSAQSPRLVHPTPHSAKPQAVAEWQGPLGCFSVPVSRPTLRGEAWPGETLTTLRGGRARDFLLCVLFYFLNYSDLLK